MIAQLQNAQARGTHKTQHGIAPAPNDPILLARAALRERAVVVEEGSHGTITPNAGELRKLADETDTSFKGENLLFW